MYDYLKQNPTWISGFTDGEGSFQVNFTFRQKLKFGIDIQLVYSIAQNRKSENVLIELQKYFNCGYITKNKFDNCTYFRVKKRNDLGLIIIPFFKKYPLFTTKSNDFEKFVEIYNLTKNGEHLNPNGISNIIQIAYSMNSLGKNRKYSEEQLLSHVRKNTKRHF
jgi:hypothetical protein